MPRRCDHDLESWMCHTCRAEDGSDIPHQDATPPAGDQTPQTLRPQQKNPTRRPSRRNYPALCVNPRCRPDGTPRATEGRGNVCTICEDRTCNNLADIADVWPDLEARLNIVHTPTPDEERRTTTPSHGIDIDEHVSDAITQATQYLERVARIIADGRGITHPMPNPTPRELARWIAKTHMSWLAAHEDPEVTLHVVNDAGRIRSLTWKRAYARRPSIVQVGIRCQERVPTREPTEDDPNPPTRPCDAPMHATVHRPMETTPDLVCDAGHRVPPSKWTRATYRRCNDAALAALHDALAHPKAYTSTDDNLDQPKPGA